MPQCVYVIHMILSSAKRFMYTTTNNGYRIMTTLLMATLLQTWFFFWRLEGPLHCPGYATSDDHVLGSKYASHKLVVSKIYSASSMTATETLPQVAGHVIECQ